MYERPYANRQIQISMMSEPVVIRKRTQERDRRGRTTESFMTIATRCSTEPLSKTDARLGRLDPDGTRLLEPRIFYTNEKIDVKARDEFLWNKEIYIGVDTSDYGEYSCTIAHRLEAQ